jgi:hypothetical protein
MKWQWKYQRKKEKDWERITGKPPANAYGSRVHELLEEHYANLKKYRPAVASIEDEAQLMLEMYKAKWPVEPFEVLEVERVFEVPLPGETKRCVCYGNADPYPKADCEFCGGTGEVAVHTYTGKLDLIVRDKASGLLRILDHKTQKRNAKSNLPGVWTARAQASLYMWVAERLMGEKIDCFILNLLTRQSDAGNCPPEFPDRQHIQRTPEQQEEAIRNIIWTADQIERMDKEFGDKPYPQDRDQCQIGNFRCDFYTLDVFGENEFTLAEFKEAEDYLT